MAHAALGIAATYAERDRRSDHRQLRLGLGRVFVGRDTDERSGSAYVTGGAGWRVWRGGAGGRAGDCRCVLYGGGAGARLFGVDSTLVYEGIRGRGIEVRRGGQFVS